MNCGCCDKTDGLIYTSMPPKVRCVFSDRFHTLDDKCDINFRPIHFVHMIRYNLPTHEELLCSFCHALQCDSDNPLWSTINYCWCCGNEFDGTIQEGDNEC